MLKTLGGIVFVAVMVSLGGCGALEAKQRQTALDDTLRVYANAIRWSEFSLAEKFLAPQARAANPSGALPRGIKVTAYDLLEQVMSQTGDTANVAARVQFEFTASARVFTLIDRQRWQLNSETDQWLLHTGLPDFAAAMRR